jgi:hypothetical protein
MKRNLIRYMEPEEFDAFVEENPDVEQFSSGKWRKARINDAHEIRSRL